VESQLRSTLANYDCGYDVKHTILMQTSSLFLRFYVFDMAAAISFQK
jgi:hypothetical protein